MEEYIENYEKNAGNNITEEMVKYLYNNIDKEEELKEIYKEVLIKLKKYNNNYYS